MPTRSLKRFCQIKHTFFVSEDTERIRMLMSEKLSDDNLRVFSNKIQISMVKSLLEPMLRPRGRGGRGFRMRSSATLRHLERPLVFARGTMAENYHLKQKKKRKRS